MFYMYVYLLSHIIRVQVNILQQVVHLSIWNLCIDLHRKNIFIIEYHDPVDPLNLCMKFWTSRSMINFQPT